MTRYYRLVFADGSVSAWDKDFEYMKKRAERFHARLESREFGLKQTELLFVLAGPRL